MLSFGPAFDKNLTVTKYCISDKMGGRDSRFYAKQSCMCEQFTLGTTKQIVKKFNTNVRNYTIVPVQSRTKFVC